MIELDYTLERDMGSGNIRTFKPEKIPTKLPNLVHIEGPNSSGKSTFLHILALSMYGYDNKKINQGLRNKINILVDSDYQKLVFDLKVINKDGSLSLHSFKKDPDSKEIVVYESKDGEKEKPIILERFEDKYNLIYDIPDKPTERLNQLTKEIQEGQRRFSDKVESLHACIDKIITDVSESRDPKRLDERKRKLEEICSDKKTFEKKRDQIKEFLGLLERYMYCKYFIEYSDKYAHIDDMINRLERKRSSRPQVKRRFETQHKNSRDRINKKLSSMDDKFRILTSLLNNILGDKERNHMNIWKRIRLLDAIIDYEFNDSLEKEITHFINILTDIKARKSSDESLHDAKIIQDMIEFLREYENSNLLLPKFEITIADFIKELEAKNKTNIALLNSLSTLNKAIDLLNELDVGCKNITPELEDLKSLAEKEIVHSDQISDMGQIESDIAGYKSDLSKVEKKLDIYYHGCIDKKIDVNLDDGKLQAQIHEIEKIDELTPYFGYNEKQLHEKINDLESDLKRMNKDIETKCFFISDYEKEIKKLEAKEPHDYQPYVEKLNKISLRTRGILQKLRTEYKNNIDALIDSNHSKVGLDKDERYFLEVSKYLGNRIGTFRHIDQEYKADIVDLISGKIITENGDIIRLIDMGTGQSQSAYLMGLLNTKDDNRKIIALFDEVAMMDSISLEPIYQKFNDLYDEGRLLVGIMVQKADDMKIISKIGVLSDG